VYTRAQRTHRDAPQQQEHEEAPTPTGSQLVVGAADDRYEREADRVAAEVVGRLAQPAAPAASGAAVAETPPLAVQRRSSSADAAASVDTVGAEGGSMPASVEHEIQSARSGGRELDPGTRQPMERAFGADFGSVRVHSGSQSTALNDSLQAKAFTVGSDIFFRGAVPDVGTRDGQELLAHELAHTVQQGGGSPAIQRWSFGKKDKPVSSQKAAKEQEAIEKKRLAAERKIGTAQREQMMQTVGNDPSALATLNEAFLKALDDESKLKLSLIKGGMDPDEAETQAYQQTWMNAAPNLRAIRPMRETRGEKLMSLTVEMRTDIAATKSSEKQVKNSRGLVVSKGVEDLMVKELEMVEQLVADGEPRARAEKIANTKIWAAADKDVVKKRPAVGSKSEAAGYEAARKRSKLAVKKGEGVDVLGTIGSVGSGIMSVTSPIGTAVKMGFNDGNKSTLSQGEMGGGGVESISNMITGVLSSIVGIRDFVVLVNDLINQPSVDYNDVGEAVKAALDELGQMSKNVTLAMKIASSLSESALASLAGVIPIVDVITNSIGIAAGISESVPNAMRYGSNIGDIYLARGHDRPELVLALKRLGQRNAQLLEQSLYKTGTSVTKLSLAIAQLATGGADMGATSALKLVVTGIDAVHSFGHLIADNVFAVQAKGARKAIIGRGEGTAEDLLRRDAGFAVDALLAAATKGDKKTQALARGALKDSYGVKIDKGDVAELSAAHDRILKILKESSDPKTTLDKMKDGVASIKEKASGMSDQAADVSTLAQARNEKDGGTRGFFWKMKMWFKTDSAIARRIAAHNLDEGTDHKTSKQKGYVGKVSTGADPQITSPSLQDAFIKEMEGMSIAQLEKASKDMQRSQFERIVLSEALARKIKEEMKAKAGK
jgi:hypothetical protein